MTSHRWLSVLLMLLLAAALPALAAGLDPEGPAAGPPALAPEIEPNDSPWDANTISGWRQAHINPAGDIDQYSLNANCEGLGLAITTRIPAGSPVQPRVTVYDANMDVLASAVCTNASPCISLSEPLSGGCGLVVEDANGHGGPAYAYAVQALLLDLHEPNDFLPEASTYTPGETVTGLIWPEGDVDLYAFWGEAGSEFMLTSDLYGVNLLDPDGEEITFLWGNSGAMFTLPETGTYYLQTTEADDATLDPYQLRLQAVDRPLLFSFASAGVLGGVAFQAGDILRYSPLFDSWEMFFDASDVGLRGNLVAFEYTDYSSYFYMTFATAQKVAGIGVVGPQDVLRFWPNSLGEDTSGYLELFVDGSDVGLTTAAESIDALGPVSDYDVPLSTRGDARLPLAIGSLLVQNNDVLGLSLYRTGSETEGTWSTGRDGALFGALRANLIAMDQTSSYRETHDFLMFDRAMKLDGVTYRVNDVILCVQTGDASCDSYARAFDGALVGAYRIDALAIPPWETP